ncbi:MAG: DsrE family protein [Flavobacteriaceae bacterium]
MGPKEHLFLKDMEKSGTAMKTVWVILFLGGMLFGQEKNTGPIIENYGAVWHVPDAHIPVDTTLVYKAIFDVMESPDDPPQLNRRIETVARYLNMHAQNGVPKEHLKAVLVVHNKASKDLITDRAYQSRFNRDNPNSQLLVELMDSGVEIVFCGQSSLSREFPREALVDGVKIALSAMTVLIDYQNKGYCLIKF